MAGEAEEAAEGEDAVESGLKAAHANATDKSNNLASTETGLMFLADLVKRWRNGQLDTSLAILQISGFAIAIASGVFLILLYRHFSDDYYIDAWHYLGSIRIAVPPLAVLIASYAFATLTGKPLTDAPKAFWGWLRNSLMQSTAWLLVFCTAGLALCVAAGIVTTTTAPPKYKRLVERLLGGASDDHQLAAEDVKRMREHNRPFADNMDLVVKVFVERQKWNYDNQNPSTTLPRVLMRALTANLTDSSWESHPLRKHAAAEAMSMYAQAIARAPGGAQAERRLLDEPKKAALGLYEEIIATNDPRATMALKGSAENNIGNLHYYLGEYGEAIKRYQKSLASYPTSGGYGNFVAAQISANKIADAVREGEKGKEWALSGRRALAEPIPFANLASNLGFAYWMINQPAKALPEMESSFDLAADPNSIQNLALAHVIAGNPQLAIDTARKLKDPQATLENQSKLVDEGEPGRCTYFVRGLAAMTSSSKTGPRDAVVNLHVFLGEAKTAGNLLAESKKVSPDLKARTYKTLTELKSPCASLSIVPGIRKLLDAK